MKGINIQLLVESIRNIALQGEYGVLDKNGDMKVNGSDPKAFVFSGYAQFNNFSLLVVYRDYDLGFDNPYQRSFSNYSRYKGSIFEDTFYLYFLDHSIE